MEIFGEVFWMERNLKEKLMDCEPMKKRSIYVTRMITEALQPLQQKFYESKRQKQYLHITMFFHMVEKKSVHYRKISGINNICN
jgi:hypothetical protein